MTVAYNDSYIRALCMWLVVFGLRVYGKIVTLCRGGVLGVGRID